MFKYYALLVFSITTTSNLFGFWSPDIPRCEDCNNLSSSPETTFVPLKSIHICRIKQIILESFSPELIEEVINNTGSYEIIINHDDDTYYLQTDPKVIKNICSYICKRSKAISELPTAVRHKLINQAIFSAYQKLSDSKAIEEYLEFIFPPEKTYAQQQKTNKHLIIALAAATIIATASVTTALIYKHRVREDQVAPEPPVPAPILRVAPAPPVPAPHIAPNPEPVLEQPPAAPHANPVQQELHALRNGLERDSNIRLRRKKARAQHIARNLGSAIDRHPTIDMRSVQNPRNRMHISEQEKQEQLEAMTVNRHDATALAEEISEILSIRMRARYEGEPKRD